MKTIIKILVVLLILTACFNASRASFTNYQFEDALHEGLLFDPRATDKEVTEMVMKLASVYDLPVEPDNIHIRQAGQEIHVEISYTRNIVLIPRLFEREWTFMPSSSTRMLVGNRRQ